MYVAASQKEGNSVSYTHLDVYKRQVIALPSGKKSRVKSIVTYDGELDYAFPPQSVTLTLEDEIRCV